MLGSREPSQRVSLIRHAAERELGSAHGTTDLERRVRNFLARQEVPGLRHLRVDADGGGIALRGMVETYYEKQLAVDCCRRVAGVVHVVDEIDVDYTLVASQDSDR